MMFIPDPRDATRAYTGVRGSRAESATRLIGRRATSTGGRQLSPSLNSELLPSELEVGFQPTPPYPCTNFPRSFQEKPDGLSHMELDNSAKLCLRISLKVGTCVRRGWESPEKTIFLCCAV